MYKNMTLLAQLKDKYADIRGDHSQSTSIELKELERRITENREMEKVALSPGGKKLRKTVIDYINKIDEVCMDEQIKAEIKLDLLKQRKSWIKVLQVLLGGKSQLEAIDTQIRTYLKED